MGRVNAGAGAARGISGFVEPAEKFFLRLADLGVVGAAVVDAEIVIVPRGENGDAGAEGAEEGAGFERVVFRAHHDHVGGVGVDVVTEEEEEIHRQRERAVEHGVLDGFEARTEDDVGEGAGGVAGDGCGRGGGEGGAEGGREKEGDGGEATEGHK